MPAEHLTAFLAGDEVWVADGRAVVKEDSCSEEDRSGFRQAIALKIRRGRPVRAAIQLLINGDEWAIAEVRHAPGDFRAAVREGVVFGILSDGAQAFEVAPASENVARAVNGAVGAFGRTG